MRPSIKLVIAMVTLFLSAVSMGESQASIAVKCPCAFISAFRLAKTEVAKFGYPVALSECTIVDSNIRATGSNAFCSKIELELEAGECAYEFTCPEFVDGDGPLFILKSEHVDLTAEEYAACTREVLTIAGWFYVNCSTDTQ